MFNIKKAEFQNSPLSTIYYNVRNEVDPRTKKKYPHRVALWAAWEAHRRAGEEKGNALLELVGLPSKIIEFANIIGVNRVTVHRYRQRYPNLLETSRNNAFESLLGRYRLGAVQALGESATDPDPKHSADRRILFMMTGDLGERVDMNVATNDGGETVEEWKEKRKARMAEVEDMMEVFDE